MPYKGAVLDLDNVLFPTSVYEGKVINSALRSMIKAGLPAKFDEGLEKLVAIRKEEPYAPNHFNRLCELYGLVPAPQRIVQAGVNGYHREGEGVFVPQQETTDFLDFLVSNRFRNCVVTQGIDSKQWAKLIRLNIVDYFLLKDGQGQVVKEMVYIRNDGKNRQEGKKENVLQAINEADINPEASFVVDDRPYGIVAGKKAGIRYGFRLKKGKYRNETYSEGTDDRLKHDAEAFSLHELMDILREIKLAE